MIAGSRTSEADLSITRKLALVILLTSMTTLGIAGLALGLYDRHVAMQSLENHGHQLASLLATNAAAPLVFKDTNAATELLAELRSQSDVRAAAIYNADR